MRLSLLHDPPSSQCARACVAVKMSNPTAASNSTMLPAPLIGRANPPGVPPPALIQRPSELRLDPRDVPRKPADQVLPLRRVRCVLWIEQVVVRNKLATNPVDLLDLRLALLPLLDRRVAGLFVALRHSPDS